MVIFFLPPGCSNFSIFIPCVTARKGPIFVTNGFYGRFVFSFSLYFADGGWQMAEKATWVKEKCNFSLFNQPLKWPFVQNGGEYLHVLFLLLCECEALNK
jgi:hypothetical protein